MPLPPANIRYGGLCPQPWTAIPEIEPGPPPIINVYPNLADKYFKITGLVDEEILQLQIFNSMGRNVKTLRNLKRKL